LAICAAAAAVLLAGPWLQQAFGITLSAAAPTAEPAAADAPAALAPPGALIAAGRVVEKIRVRYETTSKRVDVGALKSGFWGALARGGE
jgi:hypothetical protein